VNFGTIKARISSLVQIEGWTQVSPAPDFGVLANQALSMFSIEAELFTAIDTSLTTTVGQAQYVTASKRFGKITEVVIGGNALLRSTEEAERFRNPGWFAETNGVPKKFAVTAYNTITVTPPPATASQAISLRGIIESPLMVLDADEPGQASGTGAVIPVALHEAICMKGAFLQGLAFLGSQDNPRMRYFDAVYNYYLTYARGGINDGFARIPGPVGVGAGS
jgi:hypothetical protein